MVTCLPVSAVQVADSARSPGLVPPEVRTVMSACAVMGISSNVAASIVLSIIPDLLIVWTGVCTENGRAARSLHAILSAHKPAPCVVQGRDKGGRTGKNHASC